MALGALDIIIAADTAQLRKGMDTAVGIMQSSTKTMENVAKTAAGAIAGYFALDNLKDSIKTTIDLADSLSKMSQKVGVSVDALYSMQAAGKLSDVSIEALEKSLAKFSKGLGEAQMGTGQTENALKNLGISLKDSSGHLKNADQYLFEVADKFKNMPDGVAKATLSMQLFGKTGSDLIPLLNGGKEALLEYSGVMDANTGKAAERLNDSFTKMGLSLEGSKTQILTGMLPAIESISGSFEDFAKWMSTHSDDIKSFTDQAGTDLTALGMVGRDAFDLISDTSTDMLKVVHSVFRLIPDMMGESSDDAINNFGFFEYFILGLSTATNGIKQFIANGKMAYATAAEMHAKYGSISGLITNGGSRAAEARYDYAVAKSEAEQATKNVSDTYTTLLGLKKQFVAKSTEIKTPPFVPGLEDYAKNESNAKKAAPDKLKAIKELEAEEKKAHDGRVKAMDEINKKTARAQKLDEDQIKKIEERTKLEFQADQDREAALKTFNEGQITAQIDYYTAIGDTSSAYYLQEEEKMRKLAETGWYTNEQMLAIKTKDNQKFLDEQWKKDNAFWVDLFENINKAMDDQFFNAMTGKFNSFGSWLKDFWGSITQSMTRGLSKSLADMMTGTLYKSSADGSISGLIPSLTRGIGSALLGTTALGGVQAMAGSTVLDGITTTAGGTVLDAAGNITTSGTDVASIMNNMSTLNTAYSALTGGLSASIANGFAQGAAYTYNGLTAMGMSTGTAGSIAGGIGNFGAGLASPWSMAGSGGAAGAGAMLGGAAIGAAGGYAVGKIGDKLLGADTKAGSYGAIGGAVGSLAGPLGAVAGAIIGSLIGGAFGSTKVQQSGLHFAQVTGGDDASIALVQSWAEMRKKSWFSSSEWNEYSDLSSAQRNAIEGIFDTYDYLLGQLGSIDKITIAAGNYTQAQFENTLAKSFISTFTGIRETLTTTLHTIWGDLELYFGASNPVFDEVYNQWVDYAKSIDKSVTQALTDSINTFVQSSRSFEIWSLERSGNSTGSLQKQAEWAQQSFNLLSESMGIAGLSIETFSQQYEAAVKANFSNETITQWDSLGKALMSATDAQDAYTKAIGGTTLALTLEAQKSTALNALNAELSILQNTLTNLSKEYSDRTAELITLAKNQVSTLRGVQSAIYDLSKYQQGLYLDKALSPLSSVERFAAYGEKVLSLQGEAQAAYDAKDYSTFNEKLGDLQGISSGYLDVAKELSVSSAEYGSSFSFIQSILSDFTATSFQDPVVAEIMNLEAITAQYGGITEAGFADISARIADLINIIPMLARDISSTNSRITNVNDSIKKVSNTKAFEQWVSDEDGNKTWASTLGAVGSMPAGADDFSIASKSGDMISRSDAIGFVNDSLANNDPMAVYNTALATGISANSLDALMGWSPGTSNSWAIANDKPSFDVGSPRIPYDMEAKIHKDEIIIDAKSSDVLRKYGIPSYPVIPKASNADQGRLTSIMEDMKDSIVNMVAEIIRLRQEFTLVNEDGTALNVRIRV